MGFNPVSLPGSSAEARAGCAASWGCWIGHGGLPVGLDPLHRAGYRGWSGVASHGVDPGVVLSGAEHRLGELCSLLGMSGDLLQLPAFCWPCTVRCFPSPPSPHGCCTCPGSAPWTRSQEVPIPILVPVLWSSSKGRSWQGVGCAPQEPREGRDMKWLLSAASVSVGTGPTASWH